MGRSPGSPLGEHRKEWEEETESITQAGKKKPAKNFSELLNAKCGLA